MSNKCEKKSFKASSKANRAKMTKITRKNKWFAHTVGVIFKRGRTVENAVTPVILDIFKAAQIYGGSKRAVIRDRIQ